LLVHLSNYWYIMFEASLTVSLIRICVPLILLSNFIGLTATATVPITNSQLKLILTADAPRPFNAFPAGQPAPPTFHFPGSTEGEKPTRADHLKGEKHARRKGDGHTPKLWPQMI